jgi:hypothetical protein
MEASEPLADNAAVDNNEEPVTGKKRQLDDSENAPNDEHAEKSHGTDDQPKVKPAKTTMSAKEYEDTVQLIALFMRTQEDNNEPCTWRNIVEWVVLQVRYMNPVCTSSYLD